MLKLKNPFAQKKTNTAVTSEDTLLGNVNETDNLNSYKIDGTPFWNRYENGKWFATMGNHRITEPTEKKEDVENLIFNLNWLTLIRVIASAIEDVYDEKERILKIKKGGKKEKKEVLEEIN